MIQGKTLLRFLVGICVLTVWLPGETRSQDTPVPATPVPATPAATAQTEPATTKDAPDQAPDSQITDADRIVRLETTIGSDTEQLGQLEAQLKKALTEEKAAIAELQRLANELEEAKRLLQKAQDSGDATEAAKQQADLTEVESKHQLATEQFDLAIQSRRTIQEQIVTLQRKIARDQESLDKLKGVSAPNSPTVAPPLPAAPAESEQVVAATDSQQEKTSESTDAEQAESKPAAVSKDLAQAKEAVRDKAQSLQGIQQDLQALADSKMLLERNIELETEKLNNARQKYDSFETSVEVAEKEFIETLSAGTPASELGQLRARISEFQQKMRDARGEIRASTDRLQALRTELLALQTEEIQLVKQSEELSRAIAAAQRSEWILQARDYLFSTVPKIIVILVLAFILWTLVKILCVRGRGWIARAGRGTKSERDNRANTLTGVFQNTGNMVIAIGSVLMVLDAAGVPITALMGGAGVIGLAVAFGAQSLMKDYFCGFIMLLENQYKVNDFVTIIGLNGNVERITLRVTVLRDFEGTVHFIPNGQITSVTNATLDWARAVVEIGVAYKEDVDQVIAELKQLTSQLREDPEFGESILGDVEMLGVDNLGDSSVVIKFGMKTRPDKKWPVRRELLRRIKNAFDERGIEIPFPHRTVIHRQEDGSHSGLAKPPLRNKSDD